ncbi:hypothetical protein L596_011376 [Steinernema carpocapsae]|uniref:Uncharacterized protein n=1 Tax=Steinernema carpocapsae TaxID=34508 RepID=A0A4U5NTP0_STECR|nr:hypothetical protein L596_011376 [Steinernema carpocapsae]
MNYKVSQLFVITYLLLFCFFTALCTNAAKNANARVTLASENTRLAAKHANTSPPARESGSVGSRIRLAIHHWFYHVYVSLKTYVLQ